MRDWLRAHPGIGGAVVGAIVAVVLFIVPGRGAVVPANLVLAAVLGIAFGAAMYLSMRSRRPPAG